MAKSIGSRSMIRRAFWLALAIGVVIVLGRMVGYLLAATAALRQGG